MKKEDEYSNVDESYLHYLTKRQRAAWLLHEEGLSRKQIAERLGISYNAVVELLRLAVHQFKQYESYCAIEKRNLEMADFPLTIGEVKVIMDALDLYACQLESQGISHIESDTYGKLPITKTIVAELHQKAQILIYGKVYKHHFDIALD